MAAGEVSFSILDHCRTVSEPSCRRIVECKYCDKSMRGHRFKYHLGGIQGFGVTCCPKVPQNVEKSARSILETGKANRPQKRRCLNVISQSSDTESGNSTDSDSESEDWLMEPAEVPKKRLVSQIAVNAVQDKDSTSRFFYETCVDSSEVKEMQEYVKIIRQSWKRTGCSILLDGWTDEKGRELVSFIVECPQGPVYLHSADVSTIVDNVYALQLLLDSVIKEVEVQNVVQIVAFSSSGWVGALGKQFVDRYKSIFWTVDASHCLELILDKIAGMDEIKGTLDKAKVISKFVHGHPTFSKLLSEYTVSHYLIKPSKSATPFLTLDNLISEKESLNAVFASSEWKTSIWASGMEGKRVADLVADSFFWKEAEMVIKATFPLVKVLHMINTDDKKQMGHIYEVMDQAKETIKDEFDGKKSQYMPFWEAIDEIWNGHLHSPLHAAGYFLNPSLFYSDDFHNDPEVVFGLLCCIVRLAPNTHNQDLISKQLDAYMHSKGAFSVGSSVEQRNKLSPASWWFVYGEEYPELQRFATRILSQTCVGASKYTLKRSLAEMVLTKSRNAVEHQSLSDQAFVHYNLQLQQQHSNQRHWQLNLKTLEERSKCRANQALRDQAAILEGACNFAFDSLRLISPEALFYLRVYPYSISADALMPLQMMFEEFGFVAPPRGKGKGPAVTAAGYGLVPHQEPSDVDVAFDSGHPASISNKIEQIPNYGDALAVTIPDKPTPPAVPASVPALASVSPPEASASANQALLPSPAKTSAPATQAIDLDSETEEEVEDGLSLTRKRPSDTSRPISDIKKARAVLQGKPLPSRPVVQAPTKQQANLDNINLERPALPNPPVEVNAEAANLDPPIPTEANLADEDHTLLALDAALATVVPVVPSETFAAAHEASASGDVRPSNSADCTKYLHEGFGPNDLELVRAAYQSRGVEAFAADCARANAWRSHMTALLHLAQTEASALRQKLAEFKEGIPALKEATERAKHFRSLCQEKSNEIEDLNLKLTLLRSEFEELERKIQQREADLSQATRNLQSEKTARENAYLKLDDAKLALALETEKLVKKTSELSLKVTEVDSLKRENLAQQKRSKLLFFASSLQKLRLSDKDEVIRQKDAEIALLQVQVADLKLKSEPLPHIKEWVASPAFQKICQLRAKKECVNMASLLRNRLHQSHPEIDLNQLRLFPIERILVNGFSMLRDFTAPPHPFLSSWPEVEQQKAIQKTLKDWKKYDDARCFPNELPLSDDAYALFQADLDAYNARQERMKKCQAAGIEYDSDAEEVALPAEPSPV